MLDLHRVLRDERLLRALTGLNLKAFRELKSVFTQVLSVSEVPRRSKQPRHRAQGGGRKPRLVSVDEKLIYILFYFKCYPTFDLAGVLFDFDRSQAHRWMHRLQPILEQSLGQTMALPKRKLTSMAEFVAAFPEVQRVMIDGTQRPIQRPQDDKRQKDNYSGKNRRHTRTHLAVVDPDKRVLVLSVAEDGKSHDKGILNREGWVEFIPDAVLIQADLGFYGLDNEYVNVEIPHKKPKGGELSIDQRQDNQTLASERVVCEHAFAGIKRYGITTQVYRNRTQGFDDRSMLTATGLWNFYLMAA